MEGNKNLVREFYNTLWNQWRFEAAETLLSEDIMFRGSIGITKKGRSGFIEYAKLIRQAFPDFHNTIEELIAEGNKVAARLTYRGTHLGEILGRMPTYKPIEYAGVAIFTIEDGKISNVWVLGDLHSLIGQIST
jgi:steroid delta-isomerase-like uncharacterized protein